MTEQLAAASSPTLREQGDAGGPGVWAASGAWTLKSIAGRYSTLEGEIAAAAAGARGWDLSGIATLDGAGAV
ncbi:MAG: hypothetical protein H7Z19_17115, partial [Chitinophagaceae bacterium]|nr:hypothetical protein [Rubrivivax sp.]